MTSAAPATHSGGTPIKTQPPLPMETGSRPYRSHKIRACDLCRKRKSRCTVDIPGQSCVLCRVQGADCHYQEDPPPTASPATQGSSEGRWSSQDEASSAAHKRKREHDQPTSTIPGSVERFPGTNGYRESPMQPPGSPVERRKNRATGDSMNNESVHIVGPVAAEDAQVIERHMPPERSTKATDVKTPYNVYSNDPRKPILYTRVARRRQGVRATDTPGASQKEIMEQILGPFKHDLVKIYLERINVSFPIFDEEAFLESYKADNGDLPPPLLCQVYAMSLVYWNMYPALAPHPRPDIRYAVNMAVAALHEEFSAPGLSTISASLIDLTGRPIFSMTGNALNGGRTVALSHCLGLNRDPRTWKMSLPEKNHRIRLWWGVTIHDRWASFAHGVPPQIAKHQYDVPLPNIEVLVTVPNPSQHRIRAAHSYIALCRLTEILGQLLPLVYDLRQTSQTDTSKRLRRTQTELDAWEDSLPDWLQSPGQGPDLVSGSSSLQLGYLALKMLVCRVELHEVNNSETFDNTEARLYFQAKCRKSAQEIVQFMSSLKKRHFEEFWMSYSAYHLTSTATLLVRCAFETNDTSIARSCLSSVNVLQDVLRRAKQENDWELADMCLDHCQRILSKHPGTATDEQHPGVSYDTLDAAAAAMTLPESLTHNDIVDDMMSVSGGFGTMDGFPFDMTGIWDISGIQGDGLS